MTRSGVRVIGRDETRMSDERLAEYSSFWTCEGASTSEVISALRAERAYSVSVDAALAAERDARNHREAEITEVFENQRALQDLLQAYREALVELHDAVDCWGEPGIGSDEDDWSVWHSLQSPLGLAHAVLKDEEERDGS